MISVVFAFRRKSAKNVEFGKAIHLKSFLSKKVRFCFASTDPKGLLTGKMSPSAVLVIKDGHTKLVNVKNQDTITKILDMVPDVLDKFTSKKAEKDLMGDEEAKDIAFPEDEE